MVNLTAVDPCAAGFLTGYACGTTVPVASNVNYERGATRANLALVVLGQDRHLCVYSYATTDVVVDVSGWLAPGQGWRYQALTPSRLVDTRDAYRAALVGRGQAGGRRDAAGHGDAVAGGAHLAGRRAGERHRRRRRRRRAT